MKKLCLPCRRMVRRYLAGLLLACLVQVTVPSGSASPAATTLRGKVIDAKTGEALAKALVAIRELRLETMTDENGLFSLSMPQAGAVEVYATTIGYGLVRKAVTIPVEGELDLVIALGPEAVTRTDEITVTAAVFEPVETGIVTERTLNHTELKNLGGVVFDDPLRSVQGLPGVAAGDDYSAEFSVRGSGYSSVGFYIDGVLVSAPFHTVRDINDGGSLTVLNGDLVENLSLISSAAPARFGDRTGAVLSVMTREGNDARVLSRGNLAATGLAFTSEGPIGKSGKASWLASARKSYLDYIIQRVTTNNTLAFGFYDLQGKLDYRPSLRHHLFLTVLHGDSDLNREKWRNQLGMNEIMNGDSRTDIFNLGWQWLPSNQTLLQSQVYLVQESGDNISRADQPLYRFEASQAAFRSDLTHEPARWQRLELGASVRRLGESASTQRYESSAVGYRPRSQYGTHAWQPSAYAQDSWNFWGRKITLTAGVRADHFSFTEQTTWLPRAGLSLALGKASTLSVGYGQYSQFPQFEYLLGEYRNPQLRAQRSSHFVAALEHTLGEKIRARAEFYDLEDRNLIYTPESEWRLVGGRVTRPSTIGAWRNATRGHSRGVEFFLQRRSANNLSGWISYSYGRTRLNEDLAGLYFYSDFDQRHTINVYGSYRLARTLNLSTKFRYGSNFPIVGFLRQSGTAYYLSERRNELRVPYYSRWDLRANKAFLFDRWKLTLYFELTNAFNRENYRYTDIGSVQASTGKVTLHRNQLMPILPTAGLLFEF